MPWPSADIWILLIMIFQNNPDFGVIWLVLSQFFKYPPEFGEKLFWFVKITPNMSALLPSLIFTDAVTYIAAILTFYHSYKKYGLWKSLLFFTGSFLYTGLEENLWIIAGYQGSIGMNSLLTGTIVPATYYFNYYKALTWFIAAPMTACLGWYFLAYGTIFLAEKVITKWDINKKSGLIKMSAVAGFLAMSMDLFVDPIMVRNESWYWVSTFKENLYVIGIPLTNFLGWFLLIFLFSIYWNKMISFEEKWGTKKTIIVFYIGLVGLLFATIYFILLVAGLLTPIFGINISIPGAGGLL